MSNARTYGTIHSEQKPFVIQHANSTDYLLGGSLVMTNEKIDKYLFEGGYAQATSTSKTTDSFAFNYYNQDNLGNNREVVDAKGVVQQVTNYYPFGAPYADASASKGADVQPYKYNGKELDLMHGLNTYDYGARQHDPILARWDRIDPLCEKYYSVSPYVYCMNNPVILIDLYGKDWYKNNDGMLLWDPKVHSQKDLQKGYTYVGTTYYDKKAKASYRKDGTILFKKEKYAYQRMVAKHEQTKSNKYPTGKEQSAFILENGSVLVMPDNWNDGSSSYNEINGYKIKNGYLTKNTWNAKIMGHVHTHSRGADEGFSSSIRGGNDDVFSHSIPRNQHVCS